MLIVTITTSVTVNSLAKPAETLSPTGAEHHFKLSIKGWELKWVPVGKTDIEGDVLGAYVITRGETYWFCIREKTSGRTVAWNVFTKDTGTTWVIAETFH
jgi:hypothetical protein